MIEPCQPQRPPFVNATPIVIHSLEQRVDGETELLFVAFMHGQFVGSIVAKMQPWKAVSLLMLFVTTRARCMGVATRLLAEAERWAVTQNAEQIECAVLKGNGIARQFWIRKARFIDDLSRDAGQMAGEYVVMYRELGSPTPKQ